MSNQHDNLSMLEQHVMYALIRLHPNGYGVSVRDEIENRADRTVSVGSVYATLDRLEARGFVVSRQGEATPERGGRRKMYFALTGAGRSALSAAERSLDAMRGLIVQGAG